MRTIDQVEYAAWAGRLSGESDMQEAPQWLVSNVVRLDGAQGMLQMSTFGTTMNADDPSAFEAVLLRRSIGSTMLFSTVETPNTVSYDRGSPADEDIVIIGFANQGGQQLTSASGVHMMSVGRAGFMSSLGASSIEHFGVSETTGVLLPAAAIPGHRCVLSRGADLFPDTPLTRATGTALARMLYEWTRDPEQDDAALAGTEAAVIALVRALFRQLPGDGEIDRASEIRAEAGRIIGDRHRDAGFGIDELAADLHVSRRQLFRLFAGTDETVAAHLLRRRLTTAREELVQLPPQDLSTVATRSGFLDATALRAQFSRHVGLSPSAFRLAAKTQSAHIAKGMLLSDEQAGEGP